MRVELLSKIKEITWHVAVSLIYVGVAKDVGSTHVGFVASVHSAPVDPHFGTPPSHLLAVDGRTHPAVVPQLHIQGPKSLDAVNPVAHSHIAPPTPIVNSKY